MGITPNGDEFIKYEKLQNASIYVCVEKPGSDKYILIPYQTKVPWISSGTLVTMSNGARIYCVHNENDKLYLNRISNQRASEYSYGEVQLS